MISDSAAVNAGVQTDKGLASEPPLLSATPNSAAPRARSLEPGADAYVEDADTVLVLSTTDGSELFRKRLPMYARSQVSFLGDSYFAYSDLIGTRSRTHVLRVGATSR